MELPAIGLGTADVDEAEDPGQVVATALDEGYRFIDTAERYETEPYVRQGLERSTVPREEVLIATKVDKYYLQYDDAIAHAESCRERLGVETIDLLYVHWPREEYDPEETTAAFDDLVDQGVAANVGVCNFTIDLLKEAQSVCDAPIVANQVEMHPLAQQPKLRKYARENNLWLVAYGPLMRGEVADIPEVKTVAERRNATPAQISLAWLQSKERVVPIPGIEGSTQHLRENFRSREIELTDEDITLIDGIDREKIYYDGPSE
jgi:2,5-diketo-D-gluconate reductase B